MKCICGNEHFTAHQVCYHDVLVDGNNNFTENLGSDSASIYESEKPYGPYTCTLCGREYESLDKDVLPSCGPTRNSDGVCASYGFFTEKGMMDMPYGYEASYSSSVGYEMYVAVDTTSGNPIITKVVISSPGKSLPHISVKMNDGVPAFAYVTPLVSPMFITNFEQYLHSMGLAMSVVQDLTYFALPAIHKHIMGEV